MVTNWAVEVMEFLVWDAYGTWRLWWLSPSPFTSFDRLELTGPLIYDVAANVTRYVAVMFGID